MRYHYADADNQPAGPIETEALQAGLQEGTFELGTMVIEEGGTEWRRLDTALRYHFANAAGQPEGPVTLAELKESHDAGRVRPETWVLEEGGTEWKPLGPLLRLPSVHVPHHAHAPAPDVVRPGVIHPHRIGPDQHRPHVPVSKPRSKPPPNPYATPRSRVLSPKNMPGFGRLAYFLISIGLVIGAYLIIAVIFGVTFWAMARDGGIDNRDAARTALIGIPLGIAITVVLVFGASFIPMVLRLRNIGWSGWLSVVSLVPLANIWLGCCLMVCPPGYAHTRKLDQAGKIVLVILIGLLALSVVAAVLGALTRSSPGTYHSSP